jgi:hypothetical protein
VALYLPSTYAEREIYTCAAYFKITTLISSPLVAHRPTKLIFQFGEIPLTRYTRLHTDKEKPCTKQRREGWLEEPCDNKEEFSSNN